MYSNILDEETYRQIPSDPTIEKTSVKEFFRSIGKLDGVQIKLNIDGSVTQINRFTPFHIGKQVEQEVLNLEA